MAPFRRIVVPLDGSQTAWRAARTGLDLARRLRLPALGLYVIDARALDPYPNEELFHDLRKVLRGEAERVLARFAAQARRAHVRARTTILEGIPEEALVAAARPTDLLVLGTHGRRGLLRMFLGSVAETIVRHAPCPVLVVRPPGR